MYIIQMFYYLYFFIRLNFRTKNIFQKNYFPNVSIIIAARNEERNLARNLPIILSQEYPNFEVIVVNDRSWDESLDVLLALEQQYKNLRTVNIPDTGNDEYAKKMAITLGIKAAKNDRLIFTDADCFPNSKNWIKEMARGFYNKKTLVLGAGVYKKEKGFLNMLIRFDAIMIAIQYLSMAKAKIPYMGVGRNLGYTKELYDSVRGFKSHYHIPSGDDDLFVNEVGNRKNTSVIFNEDSITTSYSKTTFKDWTNQKKRHFTTGNRYKVIHLFLLSLFPLSLTIFYVLAIILVFNNIFVNYVLMLVFFKFLIQIIIFIIPFKIMGSVKLALVSPLLEFLFIFLNTSLIFKSKHL